VQCDVGPAWLSPTCLFCRLQAAAVVFTPVLKCPLVARVFANSVDVVHEGPDKCRMRKGLRRRALLPSTNL
jgi:hypothetical protein